MQDDPTRQSFPPLVYLPLRRSPTPFFMALAKTTVPPGALAGAVRREIQSLDPDLYLADVAHQHLGWNAVLFPIFAASALLLAAVGLLAVVAGSVGRREG